MPVARLTPDAPALSFRGRWWTFADLNGAAERAAAMLLKVLSEVSAINDDDMSGPKVGPRVAVLLPNSDDFVVLVHAVAKAGAVLVPLNARLTAREMAWQLHDVGASYSFTTTRTPTLHVRSWTSWARRPHAW